MCALIPFDCFSTNNHCTYVLLNLIQLSTFKNLSVLFTRVILKRLYVQILDLEASRKALPSKLSDVIIAQVQGFHRNQLPGLSAIYTADFIMMSGKKTHKEALGG